MPYRARTHKTIERKRRPDDRPSAAHRGYDSTWRRFRKYFLAQRPLCVDCETNNRIVGATEVHHKVRLVDAPYRRLDESNCIALCKRCHSVRTQRGE
jgi:5-methylcytosine-specific restriction enzyme A